MRTFRNGLLALSISVPLAFGGFAVTAQADVQTGTPDPRVEQAEKLVEKCLKKAESIRVLIKDKEEQKKFLDCVVDPKQQKDFKKCVIDVLISGLPTKERLKKGFTECVNKTVPELKTK